MLVVRPTGVYYPPVTNNLVWLAAANRQFDCGAPIDFLASIFGLKADCRPLPALTTNERMRFDMADDIDTEPTTIEQLARMPDYRRAFYIRHWTGEPIDHARLDELVDIVIQDEFEQLAGKVVNRSIYFIQAESGPIKIGIAQNVHKRLQGLQVGAHERLTLLCVAAGGIVAEAKLHRRFKDHLIRGEWFQPAPEILAEIARLNSEQAS